MSFSYILSGHRDPKSFFSLSPLYLVLILHSMQTRVQGTASRRAGAILFFVLYADTVRSLIDAMDRIFDGGGNSLLVGSALNARRTCPSFSCSIDRSSHRFSSRLRCGSASRRGGQDLVSPFFQDAPYLFKSKVTYKPCITPERHQGVQ